jgi:hypothetical protein
MTGPELEKVVKALLGRGVPSAIVADVFGLDLELVKKAQSQGRVERYGTDDMTEYVEQMNWEAIEEARRIIQHGSSTEKSRMLGMVLGKQVALTGRRTPESVRNSQLAVVEMMERMREGRAEPVAASPFIARLSNRPEDQEAG